MRMRAFRGFYRGPSIQGNDHIFNALRSFDLSRDIYRDQLNEVRKVTAPKKRARALTSSPLTLPNPKSIYMMLE